MVGDEPVCCIHLILHDMEKCDIIMFVILKLLGGWQTFMPVPCCFGKVLMTVITACDIYIYIWLKIIYKDVFLMQQVSFLCL